MKIYIVQELLFGDYGNGEVLGAFTDLAVAEGAAEACRYPTEITEAELDAMEAREAAEDV